jgi:uncharacterized protein (DUF302 family)
MGIFPAYADCITPGTPSLGRNSDDLRLGPSDHELHNVSSGAANLSDAIGFYAYDEAAGRRSDGAWSSDMSKELGFNVELPLIFDGAVTRVREALKQEGFGVLTEIDLRAAFREKLGREFRPYVILGACNPPLAFSAISADPSVGLLLPCNVTVEWLAEGRTGVRLTDPAALLSTVVLQGAQEICTRSSPRTMER